MGSTAHREHKKPNPLGFILSLVVVTAIIVTITWYALNYLADNQIIQKSPKELMLGIVQSSLLFLATWFVLGNKVYKPFFSLLEERERQTLGNSALAKDKLKERDELELKIEDELRKVRKESAKIRDEKLALAKAAAKSVCDDAESEAEKRLQTALLEIQSLREKAEADIEQEVERLSQIVFEKALSASNNSGLIH